MADDDLDAFFDDVDDAQAKAVYEEDRMEVVAPSPKRQKTEAVRVVAASSTPASHAPPPPPPPPPPPVAPLLQPVLKAMETSKPTTTHKQPTFRLFVGNLAPETTDLQVAAHFHAYVISYAAVQYDRKTQKSRGYAWVDFGDALQAIRAVRALDQSWLDGRPIQVKKSQQWKDQIHKQNQKQKSKKKNKQKW